MRTLSLLARSVLVAFLFLVSSDALLGQVPVPPVVSINGAISNTQPTHGETVRLDVMVRNEGPGSIRNVHTSVRIQEGLITAIRCSTSLNSGPFYSEAFCGANTISAGQTALYSFDVRVSNSAAMTVFEGQVSTYTYGKTGSPNVAPNMFRIEAPLRRSVSTADLSVSLAIEPTPTPVSTPLTHVTTVTNLGPDDVVGVLVIGSDPFGYGEAPTAVEGASCLVLEAQIICSVDRIAAGTVKTIRYTKSGASSPTLGGRHVFVTAANSYDPLPANNEATITVAPGIPVKLTRVLVPIVIPPTNGAFGSRFISELSVFVDAATDTFFFPLAFPPCPFDPCVVPSFVGDYAPQKRRWSPPLSANPQYPGYLLRFDEAYARNVALSLRIRDVSRELETWGTALPVLTDEELLSGRIQLIDIASGNRFRQTLRIYEPEGSRAQVRVKVYGESVVETLLGEQTVILETPPFNGPPGNLGLPIHPGYAQIDVATAFPAAAFYPRLRIEIQPTSALTRYWAFVSITNNETQHITAVIPEQGRR